MNEPIAHLVIIKTADAGETKFFTAPSDPRGFPVYRQPDPRVAKLEGLLREAAADKYWANFVLKERIAAALGEGS